MVLAQKQTLTSMEQNREPRKGPTNLWPTNLDKAGKNIQWDIQRLSNGQSRQQVVLGKLDGDMQKNERGSLP